MPRRRMLEPGIWRDPAFGHLSDAEKLLFNRLISNADDEGRILATPESLKADVFPYDHRKTASVVKKLRESVIRTMKNAICMICTRFCLRGTVGGKAVELLDKMF